MRKFQTPTTKNEIDMWQAACNAILFVGITGGLIGLALGFWAGLVSGVDKQIDNQNTMLCESALISGNLEYQKKCQPYYESHDITIVRESL